MAGGMGTGRGVPIGLRPTFLNGRPVGDQAKKVPRRHVWVTGPDHTGPHPGLVLQWERRGDGADTWWALVVWCVLDEGVTVQQWLPAELIRPT